MEQRMAAVIAIAERQGGSASGILRPVVDRRTDGRCGRGFAVLAARRRCESRGVERVMRRGVMMMVPVAVPVAVLVRGAVVPSIRVLDRRVTVAVRAELAVVREVQPGQQLEAEDPQQCRQHRERGAPFVPGGGCGGRTHGRSGESIRRSRSRRRVPGTSSAAEGIASPRDLRADALAYRRVRTP